MLTFRTGGRYRVNLEFLADMHMPGKIPAIGIEISARSLALSRDVIAGGSRFSQSMMMALPAAFRRARPSFICCTCSGK